MAGELRELAKLGETATQQISEIGKASVAVAESAGAFLDRTAPDHRGFWRPLLSYGLTVNEIATVVGIPPGTVKSRLHHAKKALKTILSEGANHVE